VTDARQPHLTITIDKVLARWENGNGMNEK